MRTIFRGRRLAAAVVAALTIAGPIALTAQPTAAETTNGEDLGVNLQVAQATANPTGPTEITWQDSSATVRQGTATLLRVQVSNAGLLPSPLLGGGSVAVNTGGRVDTGFAALSSACSVNGSGATDVVTCTYGQLQSGATTPFFEIPVATPSTGTLTHTATIPNELLGLPLGTEAPDTDTVSTTVTADSGYGFLTEGESYTYNNGSINVTFTAPNDLGGGGAFVNIYQANGSDSTCGATQCAAVEARTDWVQVGGTAPTADDPFRVSIHYPGVQQTCNGVGFPSGCNQVYFLGTGVQAGPAELIPACAAGGGIAHADPDPCVYNILPTGTGERTFLVAILEDAGFPIPILGGR
jgi:hypothetical protein